MIAFGEWEAIGELVDLIVQLIEGLIETRVALAQLDLGIQHLFRCIVIDLIT